MHIVRQLASPEAGLKKINDARSGSGTEIVRLRPAFFGHGMAQDDGCWNDVVGISSLIPTPGYEYNKS
jgi:hypothetical protein